MANPEFYSTLQSGSAGPDVALVQTWLNALRDGCSHYGQLAVDGKYGAACVKAVQEFQVHNDLSVDGKVGRNTWNAIYAKYAADHGSGQPYPGLIMKSGQSGATVKSAQQKLDGKGASLSADGKFGAKTVAAVRSFQAANGLSADGMIGPTTWARLYE